MRPRTGHGRLGLALALLALLALPSAAPAAEPGWHSPVLLGRGSEWEWTQLVGAGPERVYALTSSRPVGSDKATLKVSALAPDGSASSTKPLSAPGVWWFRSAGNGAGDAIVTWGDPGEPLEYSVAMDGNDFGPAQPLPALPAGADPWEAGFPQPAINARGDVAVAYERRRSDAIEVWAVFRPAGGSWTAPVRIASYAGQRGQVSDIAAALTDANELIATWTPVACGPGGCDTSAAADHRRLTVATGTPAGFTLQTLSSGATGAVMPRLSAGRDGGAVVMWAEDELHADGSMGGDPDPAKNDPQARVMASVRRPGEAFGAPVDLGEGDTVWDYASAVAPDGDALLVYTHMRDRYYTVRIARADTRTGTVDGETDVGYGASPRLAMASDGTGVLMWLASEHEHWAVQSRWLSGTALGPLREMSCDEGNGNPWIDQLIATPGDHAATVSNGMTTSVVDAMLLKETHVMRTSAALAPSGRCPHPIPTPAEQPPPESYAPQPPAGSGNAAEQLAARVIALLPKARIDRRRRLRARLRAGAPGTYRIAGSVRQGKRILRLRSVSGRTSGGRIRVILRTAGRRRLTRRKRGVARLTVSFVDASGKAYVSRQTSRVR